MNKKIMSLFEWRETEKLRYLLCTHIQYVYTSTIVDPGLAHSRLLDASGLLSCLFLLCDILFCCISSSHFSSCACFISTRFNLPPHSRSGCRAYGRGLDCTIKKMDDVMLHDL
jgi:hypothetical protein